jgi:flagellar hook-associated protein 1
MISSFVPFQTASRALAASMTALTVTGNNIANANTENYTRQKVDLSSISSSTYVSQYAPTTDLAGQGVAVDGISQYRDSFLDTRYRTQNSTANQYSTFLDGLNDTLSVMDEAQTDGLMSQLSDLQSQLQTYSQTPTSDNLALVARTSAESTAEMMNVYSEQISGVRDQAISDLSSIVIDNTFNSTVKGIASLNQAIRDQEISGGTPNELYDQRNALIDKLSSVAGIQVKITNEKVNENISVDNISISLYDSDKGIYDISVVDGNRYNTLSVSESDDTYGTVSIKMNSSYGTSDGQDITNSFASGSIKGYLDLVNGAGSYAASG